MLLTVDNAVRKVHFNMHETSLSLLERLRDSPKNEGWNRLAELYTPLIRTWLRRYDVQDSDAHDLVQDVLLAVSKDLSKFEHAGQPGAFRGWLKAILINRLRKFWRARDRRPEARGDSDIDAKLAQLDDPTSELSQIWNREHDQYVLRQLLSLAEPHFEPNTWKAFCRVALEGAKADDVAQEMGISRNAVIIAKCRVLNRLRQEAEGLIESSSGFFAKS
jgi:RNA polymerase sigma-70 factor (ECF subfamily)